MVMASFDIESLFTNIPVKETIEYILDTIFNDQDNVYHGFNHLDFKELLKFTCRWKVWEWVIN